jgi:hypothetical protein
MLLTICAPPSAEPRSGGGFATKLGAAGATRADLLADPLTVLMNMGVEDAEILRCAGDILKSLPSRQAPTMDDVNRAIQRQLSRAATCPTKPSEERLLVCEQEEGPGEEEEEAPPE